MTMTVANTILAQLGGNRFCAMTGAKNLLGDAASLMFDIGRGATNKANKVRVTLTPADVYTVEFFNYRSLTLKTVGKIEDVYAEDLQRVFTAETGLYTRL